MEYDMKWLGLFCSFLIGMVVMTFILTKTGASSANMLNECQKPLPRSQTCVLIAIPKQETIQER